MAENAKNLNENDLEAIRDLLIGIKAITNKHAEQIEPLVTFDADLFAVKATKESINKNVNDICEIMGLRKIA